MADDPFLVARHLRRAARLLTGRQLPEHLPELLLRAADLLHPELPEIELEHHTELIGAMVLETDGGSRGNPGPAGAGAVLRAANGEVVREISRFLGHTTNNVAEYQALIMGLEAAWPYRPPQLQVKLDSELLVRQLEGRYQVKSPHLQPLYAKVKQLLARFPQVDITHIARQYNHLADSLANQAMDKNS